MYLASENGRSLLLRISKLTLKINKVYGFAKTAGYF